MRGVGPDAPTGRPEPTADAVLLAPDGSTAYLASAVATELDRMSPGAVLQVDIEPAAERADFVEWCLTGGRRIANPFAHYLDPAVLVVAD
jgi:hypothetical protein